jgi:uncharacterized NAD(P)/FAD-binding protein YdhS
MSEAQAYGVRFQLHHMKAVAIHRAAGHGYHVDLENGGTLAVGAAVLAIGALAPRPLKAVSAQALASGTYELDPWNRAEPARSPRRVLVIGTGLTAVDTLISAASRWPHAELIAVSRHGLLPFRHPARPLAPYPYQDDLNAALLACDGVAPMLRLVREALADPAVRTGAPSSTACGRSMRACGKASRCRSDASSCATCAGSGKPAATARRRPRPTPWKR